MRKTEELQRLEDELLAQNFRNENKENDFHPRFRDVKHWTKSLTGIT